MSGKAQHQPLDQLFSHTTMLDSVILRKISEGDVKELVNNDETSRAMLVLLPLSIDFENVIKYYNDKSSVSKSQISGPSQVTNENDPKTQLASQYIDTTCKEVGFVSDNSLANFIKCRLIFMDLSSSEADKILSQLDLTNLKSTYNWYHTVIHPLSISGIDIKLLQLSKMPAQEVIALMLQNFSREVDLIDKNMPFIEQHWDAFNSWFESEFIPNNLLINDRVRLTKGYEIVLLSMFENEFFLKRFISARAQFERFVSLLFGCFYLCPLVHERVFIVMKHILFIISENVESKQKGGDEFKDPDVDSLHEITKYLGLDSVAFMTKLVTSVEKLFQLNISMKQILKLVGDRSMQSAVVDKLIALNMKDDLVFLYNSICWIIEKTEFFNMLEKKEVDYTFFNKMIQSKRFDALESLMPRLQLQDASQMLLNDFYFNFNQSSNFNLNSHFLQDCLKDLSLLKAIDPIEYKKLSYLLKSFKILGNFKIATTVIRPSEILGLSTLEIVDRIFELNDDVDVFEIYQLVQDLSIGLDDTEFAADIPSSPSDPVYDYKHLSTTKNRALFKLLLIDLKYSVSREANYNLVINMVSNTEMSDLLAENWLIIYQYTNTQSFLDNENIADETSEINRIEMLAKALKILSRCILIVPVEFNGRLQQNYFQIETELIAKINQLEEGNISKETHAKMDLESRIARAFTSSTKDLLKDLLI